MADEKYKSGPYKGYSKDDVKAAKDFLKDSNSSESEIAIMKILEPDFFNGDYNKGGAVIKKSIGPSDYRKGGMVLSTVDNRKK